MNIVLTAQDWLAIRPTMILSITGLIAMLLSAFLAEGRGKVVAWFSLAGMALTLADLLGQWGTRTAGFQGMLVTDGFTVFFSAVVLVAAMFTTVISMPYLDRQGMQRGEFHTLVTFATVGALLMASSTDLLMTFIGIETLSLAVYILAGYARSRMESTESALKYFLLGAFASGFLLFGIALTFGATGSTKFATIAAAVAGDAGHSSLLLAGVLMMVVGFAFKVAAVPFHMWTPDVYEGAPSPVTAYMAAGVKAAAFAAFARVFWQALGPVTPLWAGLLGVVAVLTMSLGNLVAIQQRNLKRMLAYSSIAHAGYLLIALIVGGETGRASLLFYFVPYALMSLGAFTVVTVMERAKGGEAVMVEDYAGLAARSPWTALAMTVFLLSLAGIPPTAGFMGKFYIFRSAMETGHLALAVIGVMNSVISVYYYLRPVVAMYMQEPGENPGIPHIQPLVHVLLLGSILALLYVGVVPGGLFQMAVDSVKSMGTG